MMADFGSLEDWGLQAIVRGSTGYYCNTSAAIGSSTEHLNSCYDVLDTPKNEHHDLFFSFPGPYETAAMLTDELQDLYKPFYTVSQSSPARNSPVGPTTPSDSVSVCKEMKEEPEEVHQEEVKVHTDQPPAATATSTYMPKYKRRKNQPKRVVLQSTAKDLPSDMWAWRKYGQKPIKGSPYPRSYYRCSSSKGCIARKQVEQSCTDPSIFIITYTAEHNHSQPTRRNALAGTVRHKFSTTKSPTGSNSKAGRRGNSGGCSPNPSFVLSSPETPSLAEEEESQERSVEREIKNENDGQIFDVKPDNGDFIPEVMFDDDFFWGLCDWNGFMSELDDGHRATETFSSESDFL